MAGLFLMTGAFDHDDARSRDLGRIGTFFTSKTEFGDGLEDNDLKYGNLRPDRGLLLFPNERQAYILVSHFF